MSTSLAGSPIRLLRPEQENIMEVLASRDRSTTHNHRLGFTRLVIAPLVAAVGVAPAPIAAADGPQGSPLPPVLAGGIGEGTAAINGAPAN
jgi:hypothetical protein